MNMNEMQNVWKSPRNNLSAHQQQLVERFGRQMRRRRRFQAIWLVHTFIALTAVTILAAWSVAMGKTHIEEEWALLPLLAAPWLFAFHFLRRFLKPGAGRGGELSVVESVRAAVASNQAEQARLKLVGLLFVITIPLLAVSMKQLQTAGKISSRELSSMAIAFGGVLLLSGTGIAARYFGRLRPQQRQMDQVLCELTEMKQ